jgi:tRNA G18 (ribose-2'-O)-methylase SpoU
MAEEESSLDEEIRAWLLPSDQDAHFRVEGRHAVRAALESDFSVVALIDDARSPDLEIQSLSHRVRGPSIRLHREALSGLIGFDFHRGVIAAALKPARSFAEWLAAGGRVRRLAVLDRLADPGNVGTIIRNAAAFGFDAVICTRAGASPYNAKAVRASATALFRLPVFIEDDWRKQLAQALPDMALVATDVAADAVPLEALALAPPRSLAVIFGGEADGLSPETLAACHHRVTIPITDRVESLNVASASAIVLHALGRLT